MNESLSQVQRKLTEDEKRLYRGQLLALGIDMAFSPDLTKPQADALKKEYKIILEGTISEYELLSGKTLVQKPGADDWKSELESLSKELYQ